MASQGGYHRTNAKDFSLYIPKLQQEAQLTITSQSTPKHDDTGLFFLREHPGHVMHIVL
jgi:hypothetical protein